jgi:hypothetical protein
MLRVQGQGQGPVCGPFAFYAQVQVQVQVQVQAQPFWPRLCIGHLGASGAAAVQAELARLREGCGRTPR